jgi:hypothetical protein
MPLETRVQPPPETMPADALTGAKTASGTAAGAIPETRDEDVVAAARRALSAILALPGVADLPVMATALDALLAEPHPQLPAGLTLRTACRAVRQLVGEVMGLIGDRVLLRRDRRRLVSHVRQIAMYVCHVALQIPIRDIADAFGLDRSTVSHACHVVEDRRDDPAFDEFVAGIERMVTAVFGISEFAAPEYAAHD